MRDKNGQIIQQFDLIKVFHFMGARRKKYYMYKWVVGSIKYPDKLFGKHLDGSNNRYYIGRIDSDEILSGVEIIQSPFTLSKEIKALQR